MSKIDRTTPPPTGPDDAPAAAGAGDGRPWLTDPVGAHKDWIASRGWIARHNPGPARPYAQHSQNLYVALWGVFCRYLAGRALKLNQVRTDDIRKFLEQLEGRPPAKSKQKPPASARTKRTYLAEIERVYGYLNVAGVLTKNPALEVSVEAKTRIVIRTVPAVAPPGFLAAYEVAARKLFEEEVQRSPRSWEPARNLALRLTASQCGLTLKEICKLIPDNVVFRGDGLIEIHTPGHRRVVQRRLLATRELASAVAAWIDARETLKIRNATGRRAGKGPQPASAREVSLRGPVRLFLSAIDGRPWPSKGDDSPTGSSARVARTPLQEKVAEKIVAACVKRATADAGTRAPSNGPRYVRTAYAAQLLRDGLPEAEITSRLGLRTHFTVAAIKAKVGPLPTASRRT